MSFTSIPILDLSQASDPATKPEFLKQLRHALMEVGFLYLTNVGEPETMFQEVISQGKSFFDIPTEEKYVLPVGVTAPGSGLTALINVCVLTSQG